jgi:long-subunit acyl-CoA synthetase (AMP-forming)
MDRNLQRIPNSPWLGTRVGDHYEWVTWKEAMDLSQNLSYGIMELELCPEIEAEGKNWRFMGIQSKNRKEWVLTHAADIHQSITTVAFYDTLGPEATMFVIE